jgi:hypothetical protein
VRAVPYSFEVPRLDVGDIQSDVDSPPETSKTTLKDVGRLRLFDPITGPHLGPRTSTELLPVLAAGTKIVAIMYLRRTSLVRSGACIVGLVRVW